jgi:hypothetical protein
VSSGILAAMDVSLTICSEISSAKLRVENLHYDLTEEDLDVGHKWFSERAELMRHTGSLQPNRPGP